MSSLVVMRLSWDNSSEAVQGHSTCLTLYLPVLPKTEIHSRKMQFGGVMVMKERPGVCFHICRLWEDSVAGVLCTGFPGFMLDGV